MRSTLYGLTCVAVAAVLELSGRGAPMGWFPHLTLASYLLPLTFLLIAVITERWGLTEGFELSLFTSGAFGLLGICLIYGRSYPVTSRLIVLVAAIVGAYAVGGLIAGILATTLRAWFFVRFYLSTLVAVELLRIMAITSVGILYGRPLTLFTGLDDEMVFGVILCIGYALLGCGLRWLARSPYLLSLSKEAHSMPNEPSAVIASIAKALDAPPTIQETDEHIGSLSREVLRWKSAFTALLAHAHDLEQELRKHKAPE